MKALQIFLVLWMVIPGALAVPVDDARILWDTYVKLERAFDLVLSGQPTFGFHRAASHHIFRKP